MTARTRTDLEAAGSAIVTRLAGQWADGRGMCLCSAHADRTPSLSVRVGNRSLLFKCFAGCDTVMVLRAIRGLRIAVPRLPGTEPYRYDPGAQAAMLRRAQQIWEEASPIQGGLAGHYLDDRQISARPSALRFHARTPVGRGKTATFRPEIIAAVRQGRRLVSVQRLILDPQGHGLAMDLPQPKLTLGRPLAGAVQLSPASEILGLAEGIETALSASVLLGIS